MNRAIDLYDWICEYIKYYSYMSLPLSLGIEYKIYFMGKLALFVDGVVVLFERCEYCGSNDEDLKEGLYGGYICNHCNAPITYKFVEKLDA